MTALGTITMEQAASLLGLPKPVRHRQRVCAECGSEDLAWGVEITGAAPWGTGFDVLRCAECGSVAERAWAGF